MPPTHPLAPRQALEASAMPISSRLYLGLGAVVLADRKEGWRLGGSPLVSRLNIVSSGWQSHREKMRK